MSQNDLSRMKWFYQGRRVNTQTAGGGGALVTRLQIPSGQVAVLVSANIVGTLSAGSALVGAIWDEDGAEALSIGDIAAGATRSMRLPSIGTSATASGNCSNSVGLKVGPGQIIRFAAGAALNTETLTVAITLLLSSPVEPAWDTTGSAGTPSLAASTISAANTMQEVFP